mmetsp:Transcript_9637/g.15801  ORF Transcript_9637/g.15801 Transcript_9637/m.15801 type:complete len:172 (-) Transcript_9637:54-569(-)
MFGVVGRRALWCGLGSRVGARVAKTPCSRSFTTGFANGLAKSSIPAGTRVNGICMNRIVNSGFMPTFPAIARSGGSLGATGACGHSSVNLFNLVMGNVKPRFFGSPTRTHSGAKKRFRVNKKTFAIRYRKSGMSHGMVKRASRKNKLLMRTQTMDHTHPRHKVTLKMLKLR